MAGVDPAMQKQINEVARAMVSKIYQEMISEESARSAGKQKGHTSFTLKKFYEKNAVVNKTAEKTETATMSEDLELTSGAALPKREPL